MSIIETAVVTKKSSMTPSAKENFMSGRCEPACIDTQRCGVPKCSGMCNHVVPIEGGSSSNKTPQILSSYTI